MEIYSRNKKKLNKKGFSLVEIVVVIAIMAVLLAVLAPSLLRYVEDSRMQRDESAVDEVAHTVHLAMADPVVFDAVYSYAIPNNYTTYTDSSGVYGAKYEDDQFWAPDGSGRTVTVTFNPDSNGDYNIAEGVVNNMTSGNGSLSDARTLDVTKQCTLTEMGNQELYTAIKKTIGTTLEEASATYKNSSYTVFIKFDTIGAQRRVDVYGEWNGTNLSPNSTVSNSSGNSTGQPDDNVPTPPPSQSEPSQPNIPPADLGGSGGTVPGGGGTTPVPHSHNYTTVTTPATCTKDGLETKTCSCGDTHTEVIPATGHSETTIPGTEPTCTEAGKSESKQCSICNTVIQAGTPIPALGHSPTTMTAKAPTCTEEGKTAGTYCSVCDEILQAPNTIPAKGHNYTSSTQAATCTTTGKTTYTCYNCGHTYSETIPALGHDIIKQPGTPATCTTPGLTEGEYCTRCSYKVIQQEISANGHIDVNGDYICDNCGINVAPACPIVFNAVYFVKITDTMYMGMIFYEDGSSRTDIYDATGNFLMAAASDPANTHTYVGLDIFSAGTDIADIAPDGYTITTDSYVLELKMFGDIVYGEKLETHIYGDYEYCYNHIYVLGAWQPVENMNGWGVRVLDKTKALYGNMLTTIDDKPITSVAYTFQDCINMTVSPRLPDTVIDMEYTFAGCTSLTTVTNFPTDVTRLVSTFRKCSQLTTVPTIPNSVTNMSGTFAHCTSMSTAPVIPNSVTNMNNTFTGCTSLVNAPVIPTLLQKMDECFYGCTNLVVAPDLSKLTNLVSMEHGFRECTSLTTVSVLPDSLQDISFAFYDCHNLETPPLINKTSNIVNMTYAFGNCYKLKTAPIIPNKVKDMDLAFEYCSALTIAPEIPLGVESMESTFRNCTALKTAPTIPNSVISMYETFRGCSALTGTIVINANPTSHMRCFCLAATNPDAQLWLTGSSTMLNVFYNEKSENSNIQIAP